MVVLLALNMKVFLKQPTFIVFFNTFKVVFIEIVLLISVYINSF